MKKSKKKLSAFEKVRKHQRRVRARLSGVSARHAALLAKQHHRKQKQFAAARKAARVKLLQQLIADVTALDDGISPYDCGACQGDAKMVVENFRDRALAQLNARMPK